MLRLVVLLSLLALSLACKPSSSTSSASGTTASTTSSTTSGMKPTGSTRNKREVGQAHVLVETNLKFNPALNPIFEQAFNQGVEQHAQEHGVKYHPHMVEGRTAKIGHKFAMGYRIFGADCEELEKFVSAGKKKTDLIGVVFAMCNGRLTIL